MGIFNKKKKEKTPGVRLRNLVIGKLRELGCQPETDDQGNVTCMFQGEHFVITIDNDCRFTVYDLWWMSIDIEDEDSVSLFNAIKEANGYSTFSITYKIFDDEAHVASHYCYYVCMDDDENPILSTFIMKAILSAALQSHRILSEEFSKLCTHQR